MARQSHYKLYSFPELQITLKSEITLDLPIDLSKEKSCIEIYLDNDLQLPDTDHITAQCHGDLENYYYYKKDVLICRISKGKKMSVKLLKEVDPIIISNILLNIPLGYCLYQQSKLILHGSAFKKGDFGSIFLGESGSGKSSLAASLYHQGEILTEDLCLIDFEKQNSFVYPTLPFVKLDKQFYKKFQIPFSEITKISGDIRNRSYCKFDVSKPRNKVKIKNIYLLKWGDNFDIYRPQAEELFSFLNLCCFTCFPLDICDTSRKTLFEYFNKLSKSVNFYVLQRNKQDFFSNNTELIKHISC